MFRFLFSLSQRRGRFVIVGSVVGMLVMLLSSVSASAQGPAERRCLIVELYHQGDNAAYREASTVLKSVVGRRTGLTLVPRNVEDDGNRKRQQAIATYYRVVESQLPLAYAANRVVPWKGDARQFQAACERLLLMEVFVRRGCPHCDHAKRYLSSFSRRYPAFHITYRDIASDRVAASDLQQLARRHRRAAVSVPVFHACNQMLVGFDRPTTTGPRLDKLFRKWTSNCPSTGAANTQLKPNQSGQWRPPGAARFGWELQPHEFSRNGIAAFAVPGLWAVPVDEPVGQGLPLPELPLPELPLPQDDATSAQHADALPPVPGDEPGPSDSVVELPWIGRVDVAQWGLPAFTLAIGLVDGFNPCAMWVLLFLLSLLVNLRSRSRILAVAGSFVVVSGVVYFAFMAAWLNVFLLIGLLRPVQVLIGLLGIAVGAIHIKDFFAFKKGVSLSIPESAKPGIYARTRAIITAENLLGAIVGAVTLAVLVNIVELLCTAGLPALFTEVLAGYQLSQWQNYMYLGLYILAYMFDDSLMVAIVVLTLSKHKMQETQGRWLKLVSGIVIAALGVVVLVQPDWLL